MKLFEESIFFSIFQKFQGPTIASVFYVPRSMAMIWNYSTSWLTSVFLSRSIYCYASIVAFSCAFYLLLRSYCCVLLRILEGPCAVHPAFITKHFFVVENFLRISCLALRSLLILTVNISCYVKIFHLLLYFFIYCFYIYCYLACA